MCLCLYTFSVIQGIELAGRRESGWSSEDSSEGLSSLQVDLHTFDKLKVFKVTSESLKSAGVN